MDKNLLRVDDPVYQTLSDFLVHPFGISITDEGEKLNPKYEKFKSLIKVVGYSILDESYYIHVKVPSESQPGKTYDVVIQFMPKTDTMIKEHTLDFYVIQFFSNSPSFVYKYAALYKLHGYMIDALQEKLNPEYADTLPEQANKNMELMYDKSIYFATKFLYDNRLTYLSKSALRYTRKLQFRDLVDSVLTTEDSMKSTSYDVEKKAREEGRVDRSLVEKSVKRIIGDKDRNRASQKTNIKSPTRSTLSDYHNPIKPKTTGMTKKKKVVAKRSTTKR